VSRRLKDSPRNQENLLEKVSSFLAQNGILVYSVCSTEPEEGEIIIDNFYRNIMNLVG